MDTVHVYDTWVNGKNGRLHFDVMTTDEKKALALAQQYLVAIGEPNSVITLEECRFCHPEPLAVFSKVQQRRFREQGGFIVPLSA